MTGQTRRRRGGTVATLARAEAADASHGADVIARRAFELFLERGGEHGHDLEDWLVAERQVRTTPVRRKRASRT